jgi:molybdopterin-guanine dinucleotide biosynthesis protein A
MNEGLKTLDLDALVLAGGESRRMGLHKALLPLGYTTLLGMVVERLHPLFRRVLVVARHKESLPHLDAAVLTDDRWERGPLVGLVRGLAASDAPYCFVVGCDMPFLRPKVIHRMTERLQGCDILTPLVQGHPQPLHAFYSRRCLTFARELLAGGVTSLRALFPLCQVQTVPASELLDLDPDLLSFRDLDTMQDYQAAKQLVQGFLQGEVAT